MHTEKLEAMFDKISKKFLSLRQTHKRRALTQPGIPASLQLLVYQARVKAERYVGKHPALAAPYGMNVLPRGKDALQQIATEMRVAGPSPTLVAGANRIETAMKEIDNE